MLSKYLWVVFTPGEPGILHAVYAVFQKEEKINKLKIFSFKTECVCGGVQFSGTSHPGDLYLARSPWGERREAARRPEDSLLQRDPASWPRDLELVIDFLEKCGAQTHVGGDFAGNSTAHQLVADLGPDCCSCRLCLLPVHEMQALEDTRGPTKQIPHH